MALSVLQENEYVDLVRSFPVTFYTDVYEPWLLYLVGRKRGLFSASECLGIQKVYAQFPKVWEVIEPNFTEAEYAELRADVKLFVSALNRFDWLPEVWGVVASDIAMSGLGLAPLIIAGLVAAAAALGIGGVIYGIGYIKEQNNQTELIREVVLGNIPPDILRAEVQAEAKGLLGQIGDIAQYLMIGGLVFVGWKIWKGFRGA